MANYCGNCGKPLAGPAKVCPYCAPKVNTVVIEEQAPVEAPPELEIPPPGPVPSPEPYIEPDDET
jgi:uncharacterized OB-fold protein